MNIFSPRPKGSRRKTTYGYKGKKYRQTAFTDYAYNRHGKRLGMNKTEKLF